MGVSTLEKQSLKVMTNSQALLAHLLLDDAELAVLEKPHTSRVVAAVLQALQTADQNGQRLAVAAATF
jgi:hypothetical protein